RRRLLAAPELKRERRRRRRSIYDRVPGPYDPVVVAIRSRRAIRSAVEGCVENRFTIPRLRKAASGLTIASWAAVGETFMGILWAAASSLRRAPASSRGIPLISEPTASALNSRCRLMANWISIAPMG